MKTLFFGFFVIIAVATYSQNVPSFENGTYLDINRLNEIDKDISSGNINRNDKVPVFPAFTFSAGARVKGIKNGNPENGPQNGSYQVIEENSLHYLRIDWEDKTSDKYLIIGYVYPHNNTFYRFNLYNEDGIPFFKTAIQVQDYDFSGDYFTDRFIHGGYPFPHSFSFTFLQQPQLVPTESISASSELREGNIIYSTYNLDNRIDVCWAARNGIGERIILQRSGLGYRGELYIATGFISMSRPHLYKQNSRPKKIRISAEGREPMIVELDDIYHLQYIGDIPYADVWIDILEVYPGNRFNDVCINFFQCWDSK
jgi:hypothetical protein